MNDDRWSREDPWTEGWMRGFVVGVFLAVILGFLGAVILTIIYWMRS